MVKQLPIPRPGTQVVNLARGRKGGSFGKAIKGAFKSVVNNSTVQRAASGVLGSAAKALGVPESVTSAGTKFIEGKIQAGEARRRSRGQRSRRRRYYTTISWSGYDWSWLASVEEGQRDGSSETHRHALSSVRWDCS